MVVNMARTDEFNLDDGAAMAGQGGRPEVTGRVRGSMPHTCMARDGVAIAKSTVTKPQRVRWLQGDKASVQLLILGSSRILECQPEWIREEIFRVGGKRKHRGGRKRRPRPSDNN